MIAFSWYWKQSARGGRLAVLFPVLLAIAPQQANNSQKNINDPRISALSMAIKDSVLTYRCSKNNEELSLIYLGEILDAQSKKTYKVLVANLRQEEKTVPAILIYDDLNKPVGTYATNSGLMPVSIKAKRYLQFPKNKAHSSSLLIDIDMDGLPVHFHVLGECYHWEGQILTLECISWNIIMRTGGY